MRVGAVTVAIQGSILRIVYMVNPRLSTKSRRMEPNGDDEQRALESGSGTLLSPTATLRREKVCVFRVRSVVSLTPRFCMWAADGKVCAPMLST